MCSSFTWESKHLIRYADDDEGSRRNRANVKEWKKKKEELKKASFPFPGDTHAGSRTMNDCRETTAWDSAPLYLNLFLGHRGRLREAHTLDLWASLCHKIKIKSHRRNARKLCQSVSAYRRQINKQEKASTHKRAAVRFQTLKPGLKKVKEPLIFSSKSNLAWLNQVLLHTDDEGLSSSLSINFQDFIISPINLELTTKTRFLKVIADIISVPCLLLTFPYFKPSLQIKSNN